MGVDSRIFLVLRAGIARTIAKFPELLIQRCLAFGLLVCSLYAGRQWHAWVSINLMETEGVPRNGGRN